MEVDLFGHTDCACTHTSRQAAGRTETFDLENDLSCGERLIVAGYMTDHVTRLASEGHDKEAAKLRTEADRYAYCGNQALGLFCPECNSQYFVKMFCRSRICERCGRIYKRDLQKKMIPSIQEVSRNKRQGYILALVTLTVSSQRFGDQLPTREHIERLYRETSSFLRLHYGKYKNRLSSSGKVVEIRRKLSAADKAERRRLRSEAKKRGEEPPEFDNSSRRVFIGAGWIATLEIGSDNNNAHCHAIVYGPIRQWFRLKQSWESITGDSQGVDIRKVRKPKELTNYVLKYITKPPVTEDYCRIADYAVMIKGTRRLRSGGIFYNSFTVDKPERPRCACIHCNSRLVMETTMMLHECTDRIDLYKELREIEKLDIPWKSPLDLPENFLPRGVTPVTLPLWRDDCQFDTFQ